MIAIGRQLAAVLAFTCAQAASAATVSYTDQAAFEAALNGSHTLVNLDAAPLGAFPSGYRLDDAAPAAALLSLGLDSIGLNAQVVDNQNFQTVTDRDRLIINGQAVGGQIAFNFTDEVNGVGAFSNDIDFGRVRLFSESNLGGVLLGEAQFGPGGFGGITSDALIRSVQFTCDFNQDLTCGVFDIQFGVFADSSAVPEPATWAMMLIGFGTVGYSMRRRKVSYKALQAV